uniref:Uncharacterized protein n=1 Tax=Eutreptiella gymnastica TaxID=73025 RepID=A0A7S4C9Y0_9EUGL
MGVARGLLSVEHLPPGGRASACAALASPMSRACAGAVPQASAGDAASAVALRRSWGGPLFWPFRCGKATRVLSFVHCWGDVCVRALSADKWRGWRERSGDGPA